MDLEAREAVNQVHLEYIAAIDEGNPDAFTELFLSDGVLTIGSMRAEGHDELRAFIEEVAARSSDAYQHLATNPRISVDGTTARANWYYLVIDVEDAEAGIGEWAVGRHRGRYERDEGEWKIAELTAARSYTGSI